VWLVTKKERVSQKMTNLQKNIATALVVLISVVSVSTAFQVVDLVRLHTESGNALSYSQAFGLTFAFGTLFFVTGVGLGWAAILKRLDLI
jgi:hypothetical protein